MISSTSNYINPITQSQYLQQIQYATDHPGNFWSDQAHAHVSWYKGWNQVLSGNFNDGNVTWFQGAELNVSYNCLDRHLLTSAHKTAIIWQGDEPHEVRKISFAELHTEVAYFAQTLLDLGVKRGDRVCLYLPMIPEAIISMLACARIGAIHVVVFGGFSAVALKDRINDTQACILITATNSVRGGKNIPLKLYADEAVLNCPSIQKTIVIKNKPTANIIFNAKHDLWYHELREKTTKMAEPVHMQAHDPLFILYTSGSTGKPKGMVHSNAGYLVYAMSTFKQVFNPQPDDIYWCTADLGWITGHTYMVYAPLANGTTILMYEGVPNYPTPARLWEIIDQHNVNILYTAPTVLRSLMREGDDYVKNTKRTSLKLLGSVGEPINPEVWLWYYKTIGDERCPIVDTWWQTETGGIMLSAIPGITELKPGSAAKPLLGITPKIISENNQLVITTPWPGMASTVWNDHERYLQTYFHPFPGAFYTGDGALCDEDGYYWITGRVDDVINVSGHRLGTADLESALIKHEAIAEAAVVGYPHAIKGQGIYAYIMPMHDYIPDQDLTDQIKTWMRKEIGAIAIPDKIQWVSELPKTRSGKILRRILRKIALGDYEHLGDLSTLSNPDVVKTIILENA
jgi:acetyl-CoA synthetase